MDRVKRLMLAIPTFAPEGSGRLVFAPEWLIFGQP
jgi:hypothetical protein